MQGSDGAFILLIIYITCMRHTNMYLYHLSNYLVSIIYQTTLLQYKGARGTKYGPHVFSVLVVEGETAKGAILSGRQFFFKEHACLVFTEICTRASVNNRQRNTLHIQLVSGRV